MRIKVNQLESTRYEELTNRMSYSKNKIMKTEEEGHFFYYCNDSKEGYGKLKDIDDPFTTPLWAYKDLLPDGVWEYECERDY